MPGCPSAKRAEARAAFPNLPKVNFPNVLNELRLRDHSVEPPIESAAYPVFVQSTDTDGNALGGIRHPLLDAPLATHVGWSLRAGGYGEGELFNEARYTSREVWAAQLAAATHRLVTTGYCCLKTASG
jgi:Alpha/beta hydrolase domain